MGVTAKQVREAIEANSWAETGTIREFNDSSWQAIADELNETLGGGECKMAFGEDMLPECGNCGEPLVYYTKRHGFDSKDKRSASFCPRCGKAVKR